MILSQEAIIEVIELDKKRTKELSEEKIYSSLNTTLKMLKPMSEITKSIKEETEKLICETHPNVCELRDKNYVRLEEMIFKEILSDKYDEAPSIQSAIAAIESEL